MNRNKRIIALAILIAFFSMILLPSIGFAEDKKTDDGGGDDSGKKTEEGSSGNFSIDNNFSILPTIMVYDNTEELAEILVSYINYKVTSDCSVRVTDESYAPGTPIDRETKTIYLDVVKDLIVLLVYLDKIETYYNNIIYVDNEKKEYYVYSQKFGQTKGPAYAANLFKVKVDAINGALKSLLGLFSNFTEATVDIKGFVLKIDDSSLQTQIVGQILRKKDIPKGTENKFKLSHFEEDTDSISYIQKLLLLIDKKINRITSIQKTFDENFNKEEERIARVFSKNPLIESEIAGYIKEIKSKEDVNLISYKQMRKAFISNTKQNKKDKIDEEKFRQYVIDNNDLGIILKKNKDKFELIKKRVEEIRTFYDNVNKRLKTNSKDNKTLLEVLVKLEENNVQYLNLKLSDYLNSIASNPEISKCNFTNDEINKLKESLIKELELSEAEKKNRKNPDIVLTTKILYSGGATKIYRLPMINPGSYSFLSGIVVRYNIYKLNKYNEDGKIKHKYKLLRCGLLSLKKGFKLSTKVKSKPFPEDFPQNIQNNIRRKYEGD